MSDALSRYLSDRDEPCPRCGYNLRELKDDRCPECGEALVLSVQRADPPIATWLAGTIALTLASGFTLYTLGIQAVVTYRWGGVMWTGVRAPPLWISANFALAGIYLLWLFSRRWERDQRRLVRWVLMVMAWAISAGSLWLNIELVLGW